MHADAAMTLLPRLARSTSAVFILIGGLAVGNAITPDAAATPVGAETACLDAELQATLLSAGIRPDLRTDLQRPIDPRLLRLEALGVEGSGLFRGKRYEARNAREVAALSMCLLPGDRLILVGLDWVDSTFVFGGIGTMEAPILVMADTSAAPFSGASAMTFHGSHLVIMNLTLRGGVVTDSIPDTLFDEPPGANGPLTQPIKNLIRIGASKDQPADHFIIYGLTIDNVNSKDSNEWPRSITRYLRIDGTNNTVANSVFTRLMQIGRAHV